MSAAPVLAQQYIFSLQILSGSDKGKKFKLLPPKIFVGRETGNHIILQDPKVSRHHLTLFFHPDEVTFEDHSQGKTVRVNKAVPTTYSLRSGDVLTLGDTHLRFEVKLDTDAPTKPQLVSLGENHPSFNSDSFGNSQSMQNHQRTGAPSFSGQAKSKSGTKSLGSGRLRFYGILVFLGVAIYLLAATNSKKSRPIEDIRTDEMIQKSIEISHQIQEQLEERRIKQSPGRNEAQKLYLRGFRDYQKGNYLRAISSFQGAMAADSRHELAIRYYSLAQRKNDELIDSSLQMAQKYKVKAMFSRCVSYAEKVMTLLTDRKHAKYEEAQQIRKECQLLSETSQYQ